MNYWHVKVWMNSRNLNSSKFYRKGRVNMQNVISKLGNYEALLIVRYNAVNIYPLPTSRWVLAGTEDLLVIKNWKDIFEGQLFESKFIINTCLYYRDFKVTSAFRHNLNERFFTAFSYLRVYSLPFTRFLVVDTRSVETTIVRGPNMQICHWLRFKQIDMSTADQLISIFQNNIEVNAATLK